MPTKKQIITIGVLCIVAFGLGYWSGPFKKDSGQRAEVVAPLPVRPNPIIEKAIREELKKPTGELTKADLDKVTSLWLNDNQLTELPKGLEELTQLQALELDRNQLTNVNGLEKLRQLWGLRLGDNQLIDLASLEKCTQLKWLSIRNNQLTDVRGLEKLTNLETLNLRANQLTDIKGLEKLKSLRKLFLENNPDLTKAQIDELRKALPRCDIYWAPQPTPTPASVNPRPASPNIDTANAMNPNWISNPSDPNNVKIEKAIRAAINKPTGELTKADLEKVRNNLAIYDKQLTDAKGLEKLTQLTVLNLNSNQLTDVKGLEKLTQLTLLYLQSNQLTSVKGLEKLTQLKVLTLQGNPDLTKAQIDELRKALPKCSITSNPTK